MNKLTVNDILRDGVYFYFHSDSVSQISICIGESLEDSGIPIFSNTNLYEKPYDNNTFLFNKSDISPKEASIIMIDLSFMDRTGLINVTLPDELLKNQDKFFFICSADMSIYVLPARSVRSSDVGIPIISTHENKFYAPLLNPRIPWGFGIRKTALYSVQDRTTGNKKMKILRNFSSTSNQDVRNSLDLFFVPHLTDTFEIDYEINYDNHFSRLSEYPLCLTYGGAYGTNVFHTKNSYFSKKSDPLGFYFKSPVVFRWDSYRTGEAMASGCVSVHLDYDEFGFKLQYSNPKNWIDYIGISSTHISQDIKKLKQLSIDDLHAIGERGRKWFLNRFSPSNLSGLLMDILIKPFNYYY